MSEEKGKLNVSAFCDCPHIEGQQIPDVQMLKTHHISTCYSCDYSGPNLWICLQQNCMRLGCSEQANDHSTEHFRQNKTHCVHMNISTKRSWCYLCEHEVFLCGTTENRNSLAEPESASYKDGESEDDSSSSSMGLVGLQNIANTCYMNSALQALSNVQPMTDYFLTCGELVEHSADQAAHRSKTTLARNYLRLMRDIWCKNDGEKDYVAPRSILYGIRSVHPMFRGYQQHDTQEFLRCFMDQLHEELKEQSPFSCDEEPSNENYLNLEEHSQSTSTSPSHCSTISESDYESCEGGVSSQVVHGAGKVFTGDNFTGWSQKASSNSEYSSSLSQKAPSQSNVRSIISDVFDGKLLSSVQCLTCDRISTREETFQDLSLPIPNRDYLNMLRSVSAQNLTMESFASRESDSWMTWIWDLLRSWLWGPSVTLYDCMASFFSADELKGDNMYSCEKCNKLRTGVKYSQIIDLPEVLCIHLKRFRHDLSYSSKIASYVQFPLEGLDMRPYLHKDCTSKVSIYNLVSVIVHHGTVGGGHYICYARNSVNNRWYEFDDHRVAEISNDVVQNCQAYVLFYRKTNPAMDLIRAEVSELSTSNPVDLADIRFYVSREWLSRFNTFAEPGPINNWTMLCPHGGLLQSKINLLSQIAVPISQPLWDFLYSEFGGGPAINMLFECETCKRASEALSRRQYYELSVFTKYNEKDVDIENGAIFAISMPWLRKWQQFARGFTHVEPGPISNANIVSTEQTRTSSPMRTVRAGSDYAQLNAPLWRFLNAIYGGGPEIILRGSVNEESDAADQDECNGNIGHLDNDFSDTESNIGRTALEEDVDGIKVSLQAEIDERKGFSHLQQQANINSKDNKTKHRNVNIRKARLTYLRGNFRKKSMKSRNTMRSTDFFGAKGNYSSTENISIQRLASDFKEGVSIDQLNAGSSQSPLPDRGERLQATGSVFKVPADRSVDPRNTQLGRSRKKSRHSDKVKLKKFVQLDESAETDV